jgi:hypothetical protein
VGDAQPHPFLAQPAQLQTPGPAGLVIIFRQPDEQAALQVKDDVPQPGPVLALGAAPPGHADQARQFAVGGAGGRQRHQLDPFCQVELAAHDQPDAVLLCRHMGFHYAGQGALVGDGQGGIAQRRRALHQLGGVGGAAQEAVAAEAVEFGVGHRKKLGKSENCIFIQ